MEICIVPVREIVRAGFDGTGGDELGHGLPRLAGFNHGLSRPRTRLSGRARPFS